MKWIVPTWYTSQGVVDGWGSNKVFVTDSLTYNVEKVNNIILVYIEITLIQTIIFLP